MVCAAASGSSFSSFSAPNRRSSAKSLGSVVWKRAPCGYSSKSCSNVPCTMPTYGARTSTSPMVVSSPLVLCLCHVWRRTLAPLDLTRAAALSRLLRDRRVDEVRGRVGDQRLRLYERRLVERGVDVLFSPGFDLPVALAEDHAGRYHVDARAGVDVRQDDVLAPHVGERRRLAFVRGLGDRGRHQQDLAPHSGGHIT